MSPVRLIQVVLAIVFVVLLVVVIKRRASK